MLLSIFAVETLIFILLLGWLLYNKYIQWKNNKKAVLFLLDLIKNNKEKKQEYIISFLQTRAYLSEEQAQKQITNFLKKEYSIFQELVKLPILSTEVLQNLHAKMEELLIAYWTIRPPSELEETKNFKTAPDSYEAYLSICQGKFIAHLEEQGLITENVREQLHKLDRQKEKPIAKETYQENFIKNLETKGVVIASQERFVNYLVGKNLITSDIRSQLRGLDFQGYTGLVETLEKRLLKKTTNQQDEDQYGVQNADDQYNQDNQDDDDFAGHVFYQEKFVDDLNIKGVVVACQERFVNYLNSKSLISTDMRDQLKGLDFRGNKELASTIDLRLHKKNMSKQKEESQKLQQTDSYEQQLSFCQEKFIKYLKDRELVNEDIKTQLASLDSEHTGELVETIEQELKEKNES